MAILKRILLSVLLIGALSACTTEQEPLQIHGAIIPHHLFVEVFIDELYENIATKNNYDQIIILSPNHFGFGYNYIQSTNNIMRNLPLDIKTIEQLTNQNALNIESKYFNEEHGIFTHYEFIKKYFPNTKIVPITIKKGTPQQKLDNLIDRLAKLNLDRTLIIASIDFTHYTAEEFAVKNDDRTIKWLQTPHTNKPQEQIYKETRELAISLNEDFEGVAIDSPESLYVLVRLMQTQNSDTFTFWKRTSSASLANIKDPLQNTSHIFGWFE